MAMLDSRETQDANRRFIRMAMKAPMLTREREEVLTRRWAMERDEVALHALVTSHTRLVVSIAMRFRGYGLPLGDLIQEGNVGLMQAIMRFDPAREVRFSTYATWWIRAAIQDFVLRNWSIVRTGTTAAQKSLFFNLRRLRARIDGTALGTSTDETRLKIARDLRVQLGEVETMETRLTVRDQSLNAPRAGDGTREWGETLVDDRPSPEDIVIATRDSATREKWLSAALSELSERERRIIRERHLRDEIVTLDELGRSFGVSKERVRQIEHRALKKLERFLRARVNGQSLDILFSN